MRGYIGLTVQQQLMASATAIVMTASASPAMAQTRSFDVPAGPASRTIPVFARQAGIQILASGDTVRSKHTRKVKGAYSVEEAIRLFFDGTGLIASPAGPTGIVTVTAASQTASSTNGTSSSAGEKESKEDPTQDIVVTGTNIRGVKSLPTQTIVLDRKYIENTGYSNVDQLFASLPQNLNDVGGTAGNTNGGSELSHNNGIDYATGVNLRGLGADSTLVLVNGQRQAAATFGQVVDLSTIPLAAIDRIDIVTGGQSSIYGADAVAGVVNVVTRRAFSGVQTDMSYGATAEGRASRFDESITTGIDKARGGFVLTYNFEQRTPLNIVDLGLTETVQNRNYRTISQYTQPKTRANSVVFAGHYDISDKLSIYADANYDSHNLNTISEYQSGTTDSREDEFAKRRQYGVSGGARLDLGSWVVNLTGNYSDFKSEFTPTFTNVTGSTTTGSTETITTKSALSSGKVVAEGPLPAIFGIVPRLALGGELQHESLVSLLLSNGSTSNYGSGSRSERSLFGELNLPVAKNTDTPGLYSLNLSVSGRYDHYSDFGGTFNYQLGARWEPIRGLSFRGSYATAFRPQPLFLVGQPNYGYIDENPDPKSKAGCSYYAPAPATCSSIVIIYGGNNAVAPERAKTFDLGFDYTPPFARWARLSFSYFNVNYRDRIGQPLAGEPFYSVLTDEAKFGPTVVNRSPSSAQLDTLVSRAASYFLDNFEPIPFNPATQKLGDVYPGIILIDDRTANIARQNMQAIDVEFDAKGQLGRWDVEFNFNATKYLCDTIRGCLRTRLLRTFWTA